MDSLISTLEWSSQIINPAGKQKVAQQIAQKVKDGDVLGVGSGSTVYMALLAISERIKAEGLKILAIPTSLEITMFCSKLGIPLTTLFEHTPDWLFDGADEVDPNNWLIKGRGGAMFKEKLLIRSSPLNYIIVDDSKLVSKLGTNFPVPVEVYPQALLHVEAELKKLGANSIALRPAKGKDGPIVTENNNLILDCYFDEVKDSLEHDIKNITGVIESGLFIGYNLQILTAEND
ncbi:MULTISPECIES: ribose 5-phosphate isomerase A [unclassified Mucilaginibacter]|uniref:ribose 5-phosphate isomerase A n=1 Tax=unclassified Mucilaginibacter TaxID=2617802 RepID=UPI002AC96951|nr:MULTISPECIES: ribose 5-phosphate isomerase A [unclassified Mucilaginibacter]MEB0263027.1 ribose 5-phosphate isomerase A [Mucilaginibacter sp. 10I4]MEB0279678.1 ribose 5-phosphate isomerase A [Mucilaginibacter sp. 10B2]MEB0302470.1 ribose 5-phosphate isomerase A [Mucilaginibacter sp. 5C4]WPX23762.1 ribose 5-phosphate isomerase A [Mucilaginibacter sp. 5C4]